MADKIYICQKDLYFQTINYLSSMENSFFIFSDVAEIEVPRFHICTWDFNSSTNSLVEFGFEIDSKSTVGKMELKLSLFIPWLNGNYKIKDLYSQLKDSYNSRFIFNDSIISTTNLEPTQTAGIIHKFVKRSELCIVPIKHIIKDNVVDLNIDLGFYKNTSANIYFRFWVELEAPHMSIRKAGVNKETVIYDIKINELRNLPDEHVVYFRNKFFSRIHTCFCFTILPNDYDLTFFENASLKNVRTLEHSSFNKYIGGEIGGEKIKKEQLNVVFNKQNNNSSYSFFTIYSKERIGTGQFALAALVNILCGVIIYIPSFRNSQMPKLTWGNMWSHLPWEIYFAITVAVCTGLYFFWPWIKIFSIRSWKELKKSKRII